MMRRQEENHRHQDQQSRVFHELSALVLNLIRSPPMPFADQSPVPGWRSHPQYLSTTTISPAGYAWLMLGISVSLMLCGSVTFFIGFLLMPCVIGLFMVFYVAGIVSVISMLGRSILCYAMAPFFASKGYSCMEGFVKRKGGWGKESGCLKRMEQHWSCCEGATHKEKEFSRFLRVLMQEMWVSLCFRC